MKKKIISLFTFASSGAGKSVFRLSLLLILSIVLTLGLSLSLQSVLANWQGPACAPPGCNVPAPINVGLSSAPVTQGTWDVLNVAASTTQTGIGLLGVSGDFVVNAATNDFKVDLISNRVGIGTANPQYKLDVNGQIRISGGNPGTGKVLQSDATGAASWVATSSLGLGGGGGSGTTSVVILSKNDNQVVNDYMAASTPVNWTVEDYDPLNTHAPNSSIITVPAGYSFINITANVRRAAIAGTYYVRVFKNGSPILYHSYYNAAANTSNGLITTGWIQTTPGDTYEVHAHAYNTNPDIIPGYTYFRAEFSSSVGSGSGGSSQWTTAGSNIFYNTGNVGIGTPNPMTKLDVAGYAKQESIISYLHQGQTYTVSWAFGDTMYAYLDIFRDGTIRLRRNVWCPHSGVWWAAAQADNTDTLIGMGKLVLSDPYTTHDIKLINGQLCIYGDATALACTPVDL